MTTKRFCEQCGEALSASANFCPNCGRALKGGNAASGAARLTNSLPWLVPSLAVAAVLVFAVYVGTRGSAPGGGALAGQLTLPASDISALTPDERVDRLFNRVMAAAEQGKTDTVAFFAPMAINSFEALAPLSAHRRYDLGLIYLVSGDPAMARAEADSILKEQPKHLLALALAMRAAAATKDEAGRLKLADRFRKALASERARNLPEYVDHAADIDQAAAGAEGRVTASTTLPREVR